VWEGEAAALVRAALGVTPVVTVAFGREGARVGAADGGDPTTAPAMVPLDDALGFADESLTAVVVRFVGASPPAPARHALLAEVRRVLAPGGMVCVLDHNRPRRRAAAWRAVAARPAPRGWTPWARWCRLAYPTARETQGAGLIVEALRLTADERVQVVLARKRMPQTR
jgi:SAM-dependent methyltransferase